MKCYKCNGTGYYDIDHDCPYCDGTGQTNDIKVPPFTDGQKEVIEATEKLANGKLICDVDGIDDDVRDVKKLLEETISRIESLTNEEWLDRKSTKEKAEWLFKLTYKCYWCGREYTARSLSLYNEKECPFKKCMKDKKDFEKWLKEKHT